VSIIGSRLLKEISAEGSVSIELQVELNELVSEVKKALNKTKSNPPSDLNRDEYQNAECEKNLGKYRTSSVR